MNPSNFENHSLFEKIEQLTQRFNEDQVREKLDLETIDFFESAINYLNDRLKLTIPTLVQQEEMKALSNEVQNSLQQINQFLGNSNQGHLNNAKNNIHSALNRLRNLPLPFAKNDFDFSKVLAGFQIAIKQKYEELHAENKSIQDQISSFEKEIEIKQKQIDHLSNLVKEKENQIEGLNSNFQTEFTNIKNTSIQNLESDRKSFREEFNKDKNTFREEIEGLKKDIDSDTTKSIEILNEKLEEASRIVNVIGNVGVTGNYQLNANQHKASANFWRGVAILFMTILSIILVWTIFDLSADDFDWKKSLIRLIGAAALSYPATYAARESTKHRKLETLNRQAELELASINPFIETLDDDKKQTIKAKLVERYFGNSNNSISTDEKGEEISLSGFEKLMKAILPLLKK